VRDPPLQQRVVGSLRRFSVIDMATGAILAKDADARTTIDVLTEIDSIFDVLVEVWDPPSRAWRRLTPGEQRALWDCRGR
jgi:hypothetical protein